MPISLSITTILLGISGFFISLRFLLRVKKHEYLLEYCLSITFSLLAGLFTPAVIYAFLAGVVFFLFSQGIFRC